MDRKETLLELWKGTQARITERRRYEWKIAFGVWAAQLAALALLLNKIDKLDLAANDFPWLYGLAGGFLVALHGLYVFRFIVRRNWVESELARGYESDLHTVLGGVITAATVPFQRGGSEGPRYSAANFFSVGVTAFLAALGPIAVAQLD